MSTAKELFKITALTNLHVGSGDQNYGIVDKLVQRDPLTQLPIIHASSLKGALKAYCKDVLNLPEDNDSILTKSFGGNANQGNDKFFSAHLLTIPVRSNVKPWFRATCPSILNEIKSLIKSFGLEATHPVYAEIDKLLTACSGMKHKFIVFEPIPDHTLIEEYELSSTEYKYDDIAFRSEAGIITINTKLKYQKESLIIIRDDIFMEICENLPVVARNRLEEPKNLWYEELVPRESEFYFFYVGFKDNREAILDKIVEKSKKEMPVQIGANATVGYGYCKIENMKAL